MHICSYPYFASEEQSRLNKSFKIVNLPCGFFFSVQKNIFTCK